jgi:RNA polymerase sigma-70 factor (ECF subfamily)
MTPLLAQKPRADRGFERIYRRHLGDVYRYSLAVLRNPADAEDVTQTTFMNAYRAYLRGERPRNAQNWLIAIAHNVCRQRFRQAQRRPDEIAYEDGIGEIVPEEEHGPTAEDIQRALGHLAFNQRAALVMRELEGRSYAEIAEILGVSVSAVETLIFRARRALREQLEGGLTCAQAERAISLQVDGKLPRSERGPLRAHLRECRECERLARSQRAQRHAFKALAAIPIPTSLTSLFGGGGTAAGVGLGAKAAAVVAAGAVATGVGYEGTKLVERAQQPRPAAADVVAATAGPVDRVARPVSIAAARAERSVARPAREPAAAPGPRAVPPGQAKRAADKPTPPGLANGQGPSAAAKGTSRTPPGPARATAPSRAKGKPASPARSTARRATPQRPTTPATKPAPARAKEQRGGASGNGKGKGGKQVDVPGTGVSVPVPELPVP